MRGVVSAGHELTAKAGIDMLDKGGNAFDAAVAAAFASFFCESALTSAGGGGFCMTHSREGETLLYDFFPDVPGSGRKTGTDDLHFFPVDIDFTGAIQEFHIGRGAAAVPGCIAGLARVYENHCTLPLKTLLSPAISYARDGIVLNVQQANFNGILSPILTVSKEGRNIYAPHGRVLIEGERIFNREFADTLEYLSCSGLHRFYEGGIAEKLLEEFGRDGLITAEDLAGYQVEERRPLRVKYRDRDVFTNPPPSSGGCLISFALKLLEGYDLAAMGHNSREYLNLIFDVMRVTDEARGEDFDHRIYEDGAAGEFLSPARVRDYCKRLGMEFAGKGSSGKTGTGNTTHISAVDGDGNAASVTTSNGEGCGYLIPGTGIMVNNMLGEEDINPHGFHTQKPGVRMSSMMSPTVVMKGERPEMILGSGGSNRIRNAILQVIINMVDHRMPVFNAVNTSRVHWDGELFQVEAGRGEGEFDALKITGAPINMWKEKNMYFGGVHTVVMDEGGNGLSGAGDLRRGGVCLKSRE